MRLVFTLALLCGLPQAATAAPVFLKLKAPLDEPSHYCLDLKGYGPSVDLDAPVQAHACKEGYPQEDQQVDEAKARAGRIVVSHYDRCLAPQAMKAGASIAPRPCAEDPAQDWDITAEGAVRPRQDAALCLSVGAGPGHRMGAPPGVVWLGRQLTLEPCDPKAAQRQHWSLAPAEKPVRADPTAPSR